MKILVTLVAVLSIWAVVAEAAQEGQRSRRNVPYTPPPPTTVDSGSSYANSCNQDCPNPIYSPVHCKTPKACANPSTFPILDRSWLNVPRTYYYTMGSCFAYKLLAEILRGYPVRNVQQQNEMCPTITLVNSTCLYSGYGSQFALQCVDNIAGRDCTQDPTKSSPQADLSLLQLEQCHMIDSDYSTYALFYRCLNGHYSDYVVISTRPFLQQNVLEHVLDIVTVDYGFASSEVRFSTCSAPTYTHPFQNYLNIYQNSPASYNSYVTPAAPVPYR